MIGRRSLDLDELTRTYMFGMRIYLTQRIPSLIKIIRKRQVVIAAVGKTVREDLPPSVEGAVSRLSRGSREGLKIIEQFLGGEPNAQQIKRSKMIFEDMRLALYTLFAELSNYPSRMGAIDQALGGVKPFAERILNAFDVFSKHMDVLHQRGLKWTRPWFKPAKGIVKGFYQELEHPRFETPMAQAGFEAGLIALAGPLAPILSPIIGGVRGGYRAYRAHRTTRMMQKMTAPLAAEAMGMGEGRLGGLGQFREMGYSTKRYGGTVPAEENKLIAFYKRMTGRDRGAPVGAQYVDTQSQLFSKKILSPGFTESLFTFFNKDAYKARWTRDVLKALQRDMEVPVESKSKKGLWNTLQDFWRGLRGFGSKLWNFVRMILSKPLTWLAAVALPFLGKSLMRLIPLFSKLAPLLGRVFAVLGAAFIGWKAGRWIGEHVKLGGKSVDEWTQKGFEHVGRFGATTGGKIADMFMGRRYRGINAPQAITKRVGELANRPGYQGLSTVELMMQASRDLFERGIIKPEEAVRYGFKPARMMRERATAQENIPAIEAEVEARKQAGLERQFGEMEKQFGAMNQNLSKMNQTRSTVLETVPYGSSDPYVDELNKNGVREK